MDSQKRKPEYISVSDIAEILSVSYCTARELVMREMSYIKIGGRYRVREEEFRKYLKKMERGA